MNWLCNSDIVNLVFKTNGGRDRMSNFVILVAWREYFNCWWVGAENLVYVACTASIVHRNHFFFVCIDRFESKVKFRQARNHWRRVLEAAKCAYANKTRESITSQKLGYGDFW